jgi:hypothetical protein
MPYALLADYLVQSSTLNMEAVRSSETSVNFYQTIRRCPGELQIAHISYVTMRKNKFTSSRLERY